MAELEGFSDDLLRNVQSVQDSMLDISSSTARFSRELRNAGELQTDIAGAYRGIRESANKVAEIQERAKKSSKGTADAIAQQNKQADIARQLNLKIDALYARANSTTGSVRENLLKQAQNLANARDNAKELAKSYQQIAEDSARLDKASTFYDKMSQVMKGVPLLKNLSGPFEKAAEAARKTALENAKNGTNTSTMASGMGAFKDSIGESLGSLIKGFGWITLIGSAVKFFVELLVGAQERTVEIAKDLSITRESAEGIRQQYIAIAAGSSNLLVNTKSLVEAQQQFSEYTQAVSWNTQGALENQVFLTKNLGIAADKAADFNYMMEATGQNIEGSTDMVGAMSKSFSKIYGNTVPTAKILRAIANTSKEIQGYFGFSVKSLAQGVLVTSQFGLELENALAVSKSLLDFESSISNELELELLTGKELNLEKARSKALSGDIAGATADIMTQMQQLTEEQRKNPLIMESMAKTTGLSADQLNRAYLVNRKLNGEAKKYYDQLISQGKVKEANNLIDQLGEKATKAEMEKTITAQDAFNAALEKAKDQFSGLVSSGALDMLVDVIVDFAKTMKSWGFGKSAGEQRVDTQAKAAQSTIGAKSNDTQKATLEKLRVQAGGTSEGFFKTSTQREVDSQIFARAEKMNIDFEQAKEQIAQEAAKKLEEIKSGARSINPNTGKTEVKVKDFVLKPLGEDTITMAGGTKLGGNVEALLQELIAAVKQDKPVHLDGQKVNSVLGQNLYTVGG
jgi:hypothetical protein